jgi:hypothetical protein
MLGAPYFQIFLRGVFLFGAGPVISTRDGCADCPLFKPHVYLDAIAPFQALVGRLQSLVVRVVSPSNH